MLQLAYYKLIFDFFLTFFATCGLCEVPVFPGRLIFDEDVPKGDLLGHLHQFGLHRASSAEIPFLEAGYKHQYVWKHHIQANWPVLFKAEITKSKALTSWTDNHLIDVYGDQEVLVEKKYEDRKSRAKRMKLKQFLEGYKDSNWYVVSVFPNKMSRDVLAPDLLRCSSFRQNILESNIWIGANGTRSLLHKDADHILHCLITGQKDWMLIDRKYESKLDLEIIDQQQASGFSKINVDRVDMNKYLDLYKVPWYHVTIKPGDCLLIPSRYFHQVRSYTRSISVTFLISPNIHHFNDSDCFDEDKDITVEDLDIFWDYTSNQDSIDLGYLNVKLILENLMKIMSYLSPDLYDHTEFRYLVIFTFDIEKKQMWKIIENISKRIDTNKDDFIEIKEVENSDRSLWKDLARQLDSPPGETINEAGNTTETQQARDLTDDRMFLQVKLFLDLIMSHKNAQGQVTYNSFRKLPVTSKQASIHIFACLDLNMDGILDEEEMQNYSKSTLRQLSRFERFWVKDFEEEEDLKFANLKNIIDRILRRCIKVLDIQNQIRLSFLRFVQIASYQLKKPSLIINFKFIFKILTSSEHIRWLSKEELTVLITFGYFDEEPVVMKDIPTRRDLMLNLITSVIYNSPEKQNEPSTNLLHNEL